MATRLELHVDTICNGEDGRLMPGAYGTIIRSSKDADLRLSGEATATTRRMMELTAWVEAMETAREQTDDGKTRITLHSDNQEMIQELDALQKQGWPLAPIEGRDDELPMWRRLAQAWDDRYCRSQYVREDAGNPSNSECAEMAQELIDAADPVQPDHGQEDEGQYDEKMMEVRVRRLERALADMKYAIESAESIGDLRNRLYLADMEGR